MGRAVVRSREKQMSCFIAFDSSLPVLDVQIMRGGAGWREVGGGQKKGNRGRDRCGKFKSSGKLGGGGGSTRSSCLFDKRGLCLKIIFISVVA